MKPSTAKTKGRETENLWIERLRAEGWVNAERRRLAGSADQGDVTGLPGQCIEVKSAACWQPVEWLRQLDVEMVNSASDVGYVVARPKGKPDPQDWVIVMRPEMLFQLLRDAGWGPQS